MVTYHKPLLHIVRGKSQFPLRSIDQSPYLIGAGANCQLQLSAGEIPMIFAILRPSEKSCHIEAMHAHPPLMVNGAVQRQAELLPGDRISFASYGFEFLTQQVEHELRAVSETDKPNADNKTAPGTIITEPQQAPSELTAEQLVDRIALELELLEELNQFDDPEPNWYTPAEQQPPRKSA